MDNITHSLVGLAFAEAGMGLRRRPAEDGGRFRRALWGVSLAAANLPDLDFLYPRLTQASDLGRRLGYLLHHRGHTHTFLGALGLAVPVLAAFWALCRLRGIAFTRIEYAWLTGAAILNLVLHVVLDFGNSYGVHPFWPVSNRWHFGDSIFILEPLLWVTLLPALFHASPRLIVRLVFGALLALGIGLCWTTRIVPLHLAAAATVLGFGLLAWMRALPAKRHVWISVASMLGVLMMFCGTSWYSRARAAKTIAEDFRGTSDHDLILSPFPANPLCWSVISVQTQGHDYVVRRGVFAPFPGWLAARDCPDFGFAPGAAPLAPVSAPEHPWLAWAGQFQAPTEELRAAAQTYCGVDGFLRFARAPYWMTVYDGVVVGDLRFDRGGPGFARYHFREKKSTARCQNPPDIALPWTPPRQDVFRL